MFVVIYGPPGSGKSTLARTIAAEFPAVAHLGGRGLTSISYKALLRYLKTLDNTSLLVIDEHEAPTEAELRTLRHPHRALLLTCNTSRRDDDSKPSRWRSLADVVIEATYSPVLGIVGTLTKNRYGVPGGPLSENEVADAVTSGYLRSLGFDRRHLQNAGKRK